MAPPLVTLLSTEPEIQYVALRNINIITQKYPDFLKNDVKAFFVKYNDPIYVKLEKLEILNRLVNEENATIVLSELKEYSSEVDIDFVRKAIRSIGHCALKVELAADRCVKILVELVETQINYVVQESVIVIKDIIRRYPNRYESVIEKVSASAGSIDEPEARAALIWILGEFSDCINDIGSILRAFFDGFVDEATVVQLQLLTAVVKVFLRSPKENKDLVQEVLTIVTQKCGNPDLRDRGHIYWRLLSNDSTSARDIVLAEKPLISEQTTNLDSSLLTELISQLATLASIYHKTSHSFIHNNNSAFKNPFASKTNTTNNKITINDANLMETDDKKFNTTEGGVVEDLLLDLSGNTTDILSAPNSTTVIDNSQNNLSELTSIMGQLSMGNQPTSNTDFNFMHSNSIDLLQGLNLNQSNPSTIYIPPKSQYLDFNNGKGLEVLGTFAIRSGILFMDLTLKNMSLVTMTSFSIAINQNTFGVGVSPGGVFPQSLAPQQSVDVTIPLNYQGTIQVMSPINALQVGIRNNIDVLYFTCLIPLHFCLVSQPVIEMNQSMFQQSWESFPTAPNMVTACTCAFTGDALIYRMNANYIFIASKLFSPDTEQFMAFGALNNGNGVLIQLQLNPITKQCNVAVKSNNPLIVPDFLSLFVEIISH